MSAEDYQFPPEDLTGLTDEELADSLAETVAAFDALRGQSTVTTDDLKNMRELADTVTRLRTEQAARDEAAVQAQAEIDQLAAQVTGEDADGDTADTGAGNGDDGDADGDDGDEDGDGEAATASTAVVPAPRRSLNLSSVRARQPKTVPEVKRGVVIEAAVDVPGHRSGAPLDMDTLIDATVRRANALKSAGGGQGMIASYKLPFDDALTVDDLTSAPAGTNAIIAAARQSRLPQGDLVASGGWCAPSETVYDIADISCPEMLWDAPEIQLSRGGIRYFLTPPLDVASLTWIHTEADDIAGNTKPCFHVPCPEPEEVRCDAVGVCLESGILTERFFPELVGWYVRNSMVALEIRIRQHLYEQAVAASTPVTIAPTFGALSAVYAAVGLQAADMIERYSLCDRISLEVVFPWWVRNLFLADLARQNGVPISQVDASEITSLFATLGVRVQFARGLTPAVPTDIGGATPAVDWPEELQFLIYPAGAFQIGRGADVNLGAIYDSAKFQVNDYTAIFAESCVALVNRGPEARAVTVPICPSGATGAQVAMTCPAA